MDDFEKETQVILYSMTGMWFDEAEVRDILDESSKAIVCKVIREILTNMSREIDAVAEKAGNPTDAL